MGTKMIGTFLDKEVNNSGLKKYRNELNENCIIQLYFIKISLP
jgi:hypothetical protein